MMEFNSGPHIDAVCVTYKGLKEEYCHCQDIYVDFDDLDIFEKESGYLAIMNKSCTLALYNKDCVIRVQVNFKGEKPAFQIIRAGMLATIKEKENE